MRHLLYSTLLHIGLIAMGVWIYLYTPVVKKPKEMVVTMMSHTVPPKEQPQTTKALPVEPPQKPQPQQQVTTNTITTKAPTQPQTPLPNKITNPAPTPTTQAPQDNPKPVTTKQMTPKAEPLKAELAKAEPKEENSQNKQKAVAQYRAYVQQKIESAKTYPPQAMDLGQTGTVKMQFKVSRDGTVSAVSIVSGSGYSILDKATKRLIENMKFKPLPAEIDDGFMNFSSLNIAYKEDD